MQLNVDCIDVVVEDNPTYDVGTVPNCNKNLRAHAKEVWVIVSKENGEVLDLHIFFKLSYILFKNILLYMISYLPY